MIPQIGPLEWLVILLVVVLVIGPKRLMRWAYQVRDAFLALVDSVIHPPEK